MEVGDLRRDELDGLSWSGSASHLRSIGVLLDRCARGEAAYLVVRDGAGATVCKGAIVYDEWPGAGSIIQVATRRELEGRGLATLVVAEAGGGSQPGACTRTSATRCAGSGRSAGRPTSRTARSAGTARRWST